MSYGVRAMMWMDRLAFVCACLLFLVFTLLAAGSHNIGAVLDIEVAKAIAILVGGPWLVLRGLYFMFTGRLAPRPEPQRAYHID